ncbi:MAG: TraR/DksA C4-type zinc finger protein [Candidatus Zixiibacteriota bacterium]|nr:MAG: TraR/DksA C4-type zinc finger protein [candidate division Zixibacteria bacterium]
MRKADLERCRQLLLEKRKALFEELSAMNTKLGKTIKESTGDLSSYSYHMADQGTDAMERELTFMLSSKSGRFLYHIDEALRRIDRGDYGKCVTCGKQIGIDRLKAVPHARLCIDCKSAEEDKKRTGRK